MNAGPNISLRRVTRRRLFLIPALVASLSFTASSAAGTSLVDPSLISSSVAGKPVTVVINSVGNGTWSGGSFVAGDRIFLGQSAYRDAEHGGGVGLFLLLHEAGHTTGITDEHTADCFALARIRPVLRRYWHLRLQQVDQRYADALLWPGKYDGNRCADVGKDRERH